ncbi:MAG: ABC transporter permease [Phycisphaerales bacterium]|nr:ABC transporter permease [Phycisphaerales bacterium]
MLAYVIRRLLLMIPTLIGITFLVFMLFALSPGGIGAALRFSGGGGQSGQDARAQQAYLEDRYGLDDPAAVQYVRWLARISPIKFGNRDQRDPAGTIIRPPKPLKEPSLIGVLYGSRDQLVKPSPVVPAQLDDAPDQRNSAYRNAASNYQNERLDFIAAETDLRLALSTWGTTQGIRKVLNAKSKLDPSKLRGLKLPELVDGAVPITNVPQAIRDQGTAATSAYIDASRNVVQAYERAIAVHNEAQKARDHLANVYAGKPYPEVGFPIIPGALSVGPPDFGTSFSRSQPVLALIRTALPVTLLLNMIAVPLIYLIAIPSGILAATRAGSWFDVCSGAFYVALWSVPVVWAGTLLIGFVANERSGLGWFPVAGLHSPEADAMPFLPVWGQTNGFLLDTMLHICLPVACLVYAGFAVLSKQTRAAMLDNFNADYVRTAKAKGVSHKDVVMKHVFRNSLLPVITMFAAVFPAMLAGSVVVEKIFSVPGMGKLVLDGINLRDRELLLANTLMIATVNLLALLLADILYALADPRVTYD